MKTSNKNNFIQTLIKRCQEFILDTGFNKASAIPLLALLLICSFKSKAQSPVVDNLANSAAEKDLTPEQGKVIATFFQAIRERNHKIAVPILAEDMTWYQPGHNQFSGVKRSAKEVVDLFRGFIRMSDTTLHLDSARIIGINGNNIACLLCWNASQPIGKVLKVNNIDIYTIVNCKIQSVTVYSEDQLKEDDFWGSL